MSLLKHWGITSLKGLRSSWASETCMLQRGVGGVEMYSDGIRTNCLVDCCIC